MNDNNIIKEIPLSEAEEGKKIEKKKAYESPELTVIEIETEDIINTSNLIGSEISVENLLGSGQIDFDLIY